VTTYRRQMSAGERKKIKRRTGVRRDAIQAQWEQRIFEGESIKEDWKKEFGVEALEQAYYGHQKPDYWEDRDWFTLNLFFSSVKVLKRNICPRELSVRMRLTKSFVSDVNMIGVLEQNITVRQALLQFMITQLDLYKEGRLSYLNSLWQFGCLKVGYSAEMGDNPNAGGVMFDRGGQIIADEEDEPMVEPPESAMSEEFFIDQIDPDCIIVDRYCRNSLDKTGRFVAQKMFIPVEELQDDPLYPKSRTKDLSASSLEEAERRKLQADLTYRAKWQEDTGGALLPENELVVVYEIYDLRNKEMLTLARGASKLLKDPGPLPPGVDLHPFLFLKFNERRDSFYPVPILYNWWGPQYEYNLTRNQMAIHRKRFNRKYLADKNKILPDELEKLQAGEDGTIIGVEAMGAVEPVKDAPLDTAVYPETRMLREEFMEVTGVGQLQRSQTGAESATEAEIVERRAREGEIDEHEQMLDFLGEATKKLHNSVEANMTQEGAVELIGPAGASWMGFGPENFDKIEGEVLFTVEVDEDTRMTLQVERSQLLQLLEILGRNPMLALDDVVLRAVVSKFPALANNELLIQRLQGLAQFMMQVQMAQEQKKAGGGQAKKVQQTSTGSEAQKARKVSSK